MTQNINPEALAELIAPMLVGTYYCNRAWAAWSIGTMSRDDFSRVDESDTPHEIAAAILAALPELLAAQPQATGKQSLQVVARPASSAAGQYTVGHCENHKQPGGCPLHNLQCDWPACDKRDPAPPVPAVVLVDELKNAVRVLLELPQLRGALAYNAQSIIDRVRAALAANPQPAAQGVDLEQFRPFVQQERDYLVGRIERCDAIGTADRLIALQNKLKHCDRLLALIASQHQQKESGDGARAGISAGRHEDMSQRGRLVLHAQDDGDMLIGVVEDPDTGSGLCAHVEFCSSGGRSPRTLQALRELSHAMVSDNVADPRRAYPQADYQTQESSDG